MTEREKYNISETKQRIFARDGYTCLYPNCNKPAVFLAHGIAQTKANIAKYGKDIIHSDYNLFSVCENQNHNDWFNFGNVPEKCKEFAEKNF